MTPTDLYFIDFDGTLFQREAFWNDVQELCMLRFSISKDFFQRTYADCKDSEGTYNIDQHLILLGISLADITSLLNETFKKQSYAFPEVAEFIQNHKDDTLVILTQGISWFQRAKIDSISSIRDLRIATTEEKKRKYIEDTVGFYENGVLWEGAHYNSLTYIDNRADAFLPEDHGTIFRQFRIRRSEDEDTYAKEPTQKYSTEVRTLLDIP